MGDCIIESSGGVLVVRFNRPESMNAMGGTLMDEFDAAMDEAELNDRVKAIVVTGEGRAWCAGADLQAAANRGAETEERHDIRARTLDRFGDIGRTVLRLQEIGKPTIAAVNGAAVGGGFGLCAGFDIRLASEKARFSTIFIKRALAPDFGLSWSLPRLVGPQVAADLFYT
ncbi:MAG TPA: enoyl-CoA hydratase/isomerase family protein, partial [Dehalococcoidia bacterium]|nr:enoyl-CoA hydratase/isomerase family protein [Dehalococcoidia bacterium]